MRRTQGAHADGNYNPDRAVLLQKDGVRRVVYDEAGQPNQHYEPTRYRYRMKMSRTGGTTQVWIVD